MKLLGSGVDTLVLNLYWDKAGAYTLPEEFASALAFLKEQAKENPQSAIYWGIDAFIPLPVDPDGSRLFEAALVLPSVRHYEWGLSFANMVFVRLSRPKATTSVDFPAVRVEFTGSYMHRMGRDVDAVVRALVEAMENLTGHKPSRVQVSRVDLFADVLVPHGYLRLESLPEFSSRARVRGLYSMDARQGPGAPAPGLAGGPMSNTPPSTGVRVPDSWAEGPTHVAAYLRGYEWSGFTFGRGALMARVYSKTLEAKFKGASRALLRDYEATYGPLDGMVVRAEFQLTPDVLREMVVVGDGADVRDWDTFLWALPSIWAYLTGTWLVHHSVGGYSLDDVRHAPVSPYWEVVQGAFRGGENAGRLVRERRVGLVDAVALARQALGAYMTALASIGRQKGQKVLAMWSWLLREVGVAKGEVEVLPQVVLARKLAKFGVMPEAMVYGGV
jgi:hypothetical protein